MNFARLLNVGFCLVAASASISIAWASGRPASVQASIALQFLQRMETGRTAEAHTMLEPQVGLRYPASKLGASASRWKLSAVKVRQLKSERAIPSREAYANQIYPRASVEYVNRPTYIVCMADAPITGFGKVTYVAVILVQDRRRLKWMVSDYRYQSQPDRLCAA